MNKTLRTIAAVSAVALLTVACSSKAPEAERTTGKYGSDVDLKGVGKTKKLKQATPIPAKPAGGARVPVEHEKASAPGGGGFTPDISQKPIDGGDAGVNAFFFLNKRVPKMVIEVDAVRGAEPSAGAINLVRQRVASFADKPSGIFVLPTETIPQGRDVWSEADAKAAEDKYRDTHNSKDQVSIYLLYVDGESSRPEPIGVAYSGSSAVIYIEKIRGIGTALVPSDGIEKATVVHEVGHLFALVGLTYKSPRPHEDPNSPGHSKNRNSVMYYAVESVNVVGLLGGNSDPPNAFDKDDLADLADLKTGKLG